LINLISKKKIEALIKAFSVHCIDDLDSKKDPIYHAAETKEGKLAKRRIQLHTALAAFQFMLNMFEL
jgi:hypothetical protein